MKREFSDEEEAFIKTKLASRGGGAIDEKTKKVTVQPRERVRPKRVFFFQRLNFWLGLIITIPFLITAFILYVVIRLEATLGKENIALLTQSEIPPDVMKLIDMYGLGWLPGLLEFYTYRGAIIAGVFALFFTLAALVYGVAFLLKQRRAKKESSNE